MATKDQLKGVMCAVDHGGDDEVTSARAGSHLRRGAGTPVARFALSMRVRLTRKLAKHIDGVDLTAHEVGDVLDLPAREAHLLVAEQWAIPERGAIARATAGDRATRPTLKFRRVQSNSSPLQRPRE